MTRTLWIWWLHVAAAYCGFVGRKTNARRRIAQLTRKPARPRQPGINFDLPSASPVRGAAAALAAVDAGRESVVVDEVERLQQAGAL